VVLDRKLTGADHLRALTNKGCKVTNIIISLSGVRWGAHPSRLLSIYRAVFRGAIEYGAQVLSLHRNRTLFRKIQKQRYRIIRAAMDFRQSAPINILLAEACEPPLGLRFSMLTSRYIFKSCARNSSLVICSLQRLNIASKHSSRNACIHTID